MREKIRLVNIQIICWNEDYNFVFTQGTFGLRETNSGFPVKDRYEVVYISQGSNVSNFIGSEQKV